jgi:queuine/archaeosine tRNA-ribosyltransferase
MRSFPVKRIYLSWSPARGNPKLWEFLRLSHLMINAFDFWDRGLNGGSASELLGFGGEIFCDSGGFQVLAGRKTLEASQVITLQRKLGASWNAALDDGKDFEKHLRNLDVYVRFSQDHPDFGFVPVIPIDLSERNLLKMKVMCPKAPVIAIGKVVPYLFPLKDSREILRALARVKHIKEVFPNSRIHVFGLGGIATAALFFSVADSVDSTAWIHDARFGKLRLLGGGVARNTRPRSIRTFRRRQKFCGCPSCRRYGARLIRTRGVTGVQLRAIHNAWVSLGEIRLLNKALRNRRYEEYVISRISRSPSHRSILPCVQRLLWG